MTTLVTGAAGFIGFHTALALLDRGETVVGIDNLNTYYLPKLKQARLSSLQDRPGFTFHHVDISDAAALRQALQGVPVRKAIHLAAQAGVRYSLQHPEAYAASNLVGHLNILEFCRHQDGLEHLVYASSSSVYGGSREAPFHEGMAADRPVSFYAATKRADELMSFSYSHLYGLPQTGLRFFTVYGPWGRPDMAMWLFSDAILDGRPIDLFDEGRGLRDFTYIDDAVAGTLAVAARPPTGADPHRIYNIGSDRPERVTEVVGLLESALGRKAEIRLLPAQPGDVPMTHADLTAIARDVGYSARTPIIDGVPRFARWFLDWRERLS